MRVLKPLIMLAGLAAGLATLAGCSFNLFSIFTGVGKSYKALLNQADDAYAAGDYQTALDKYGQAVADNSEGSRARVGYVNAFSRIHFVDFLYVAQQFGTTNFSPSGLLNDPVVVNGVIGAGGTFQTAIDYLSPIANGACDGEITFDDFSVNLQLALSYLFRGVVRIADSNGDGTIAGAGDILTLDETGMPGFNTNVLNFSSIGASLANAQSPSNGISGSGGGNPLAVFGSITSGFGSLDNMVMGTNTDYRWFLQALHDSVEVSLSLLKAVKSPFDYIDASMSCLNRLADKYDSHPIVTNVTRPIQDAYDQVNQYRLTIETFGSTFNDFHQMITGVYAYTSTASVITFVPSPFSTHMAGSPGGLMWPLGASQSGLWGQTLSVTNVSTLSNVIKNALSSFTNIDLTTLLGQWLGGIGGGF